MTIDNERFVRVSDIVNELNGSSKKEETEEHDGLSFSEFNRQIDRLMQHGYHKELNMTKHEYRESVHENILVLSLLRPKNLAPEFQPYIVDPRLGLTKTCKLLGIKFEEYGYDDDTFVPYDERYAELLTNKPYLVWATDGSSNLNRKPSDCRAKCTGERLAGTADVLIAIFAQRGELKHIMDGPGSVHRDDREGCAFLGRWCDVLGLFAGRNGDASPRCGAVVFVRGC